jgi:hypothetical protein
MAQSRPDDPGRRSFMVAAASLPLGAATLAAGTAARAAPPETLSPAERLRLYMLMRGALDEQLVVSFIECNYWGIVNAEMTPFYNLVAATFARYRPAHGGGYESVSFEIEYFLDPATDAVLHEWKNPYTGKTVLAKHTDSEPVKYIIDPDCQIHFPPPPLTPGTVNSNATQPLRIVGDDVWSTETIYARVPVPGEKPVIYDEKIINHARLSTLTRSGITRAGADVTYIGISSFRPWQEMDKNQPGQMLGLGHGSVGIDPHDLPPAWIAATRQHRPQALIDPGVYLDPLWHQP